MSRKGYGGHAGTRDPTGGCGDVGRGTRPACPSDGGVSAVAGRPPYLLFTFTFLLHLSTSPMRTKVNRQNRFGDFRLSSRELDVCLSPIRNSELLSKHYCSVAFYNPSCGGATYTTRS